MNKRISDEKLCILSNRKSRDMYYLSPEEFDNLVNDLKDAREAVKTIEAYGAMLKNEKPSLAEHLQKLANKHKVIFEIIVGERLVFYCDGGSLENNGIIAWTEAEPFFLFDARDFDGDLSGKFIIKPEVTDE